MEGHPTPLTLDLSLDLGGHRFALQRTLVSGRPLRLSAEGSRARLNGRSDVPGAALPAVEPLKFRTPTLAARPRSLREKDYLKKVIEGGRYR